MPALWSMGVKADKAIATYRRMRAQPLWRLLASTTGPTVIGLLQSHLYEGERSLPASIFHERIARDLEELRAQGEDFPQTAQAYVASGLADVREPSSRIEKGAAVRPFTRPMVNEQASGEPVGHRS